MNARFCIYNSKAATKCEAKELFCLRNKTLTKTYFQGKR